MGVLPDTGHRSRPIPGGGPVPPDGRNGQMSFIDKAKHKAEELIGEVKEKVGDLTGNDRLTAEGRKDQATGNAKQAGDPARDAASNLGDAVTRDKR